MPHLSTEELLLRLDDELVPLREGHLEECPRCQQSLVHLQSVLYEVEHELRTSVEPESADGKAESWARLETAVYGSEKVTAFPVRWGAVYAAAACLTLAALGGYLATNNHETILENTSIAEARPDETSLTSFRERGVRSSTRPGTSAETPREPEPGLPADWPASEQLSLESAQPVVPAAQPAPQRFELVTAPAQPSEEALAGAAPLLTPSGEPEALAITWEPELPAFEPRRTGELAETPTSARAAGPEQLAALVTGHEILRQAGVWQEDIRPIATADGLLFEGTVEDRAVRKRVIQAVRRVAGDAPVAFNFSSRQAAALPLLATASFVNQRPSGGAARNSLLAHFHDAARRSFTSPLPSQLEAELDRYVSEIFHSQSELLTHAYALNRLLEVFDGARVGELDANSAQTLQRLVSFHLSAVRERQGRIYDRLSEALPRRYWSYRSDTAIPPAPSDWGQEGQALLEDALALDANLTALLATPEGFVDASSENLSCGELLQRIRVRVSRLQPSR